MFIVSPTTVLNPAALETVSTPKRMLGRILVLPRRGTSAGVWARLIFEIQPLRFALPLAPLVAAMLVWRDLAMPIAQAPLFLFILVGFVEMKVLRISDKARAALIDEDEAARALDALRFRGVSILKKIAARRGLGAGEILLVVEQSELARVAPLTLVSVQQATPRAEVLALTAEERALIEADLFDDALSERLVHRVALREDEYLRSVAFDARGVTAHARLSARLSAPAAAADQPA